MKIAAIFSKIIDVSAPASLFAGLAIAIAFSASCGKRGAPQPPRERVTQIVEISAFQRGTQVILSWQMPARNAPKGNTLNISRADVYRLAEPITLPAQISEEEFASRSTLIAALPLTDQDFGLKTMTFRDTLQFAGQPARLRYAIRFVNASGQRAGFSNTLVVEPASKIAEAPTDLTATMSQDAVRLTWQPPTRNVDGSTPVSVQGYYIYRSPSQTVPAKQLNTTPISATSFEDETFEFGKQYYYFVRAVSVGVQAEPVESSESNVVELKPLDTFAPTPPSALTIAAAPGTISLFFAVNPEQDIAGYRIYRTTDETQVKVNWELLTAEPLKLNTFQDSRVEAGKKYFYYVTAIDSFGNVSEPSEVVSETAP